MQEDMHYYGTYAMARAAGLTVEQSKIIAYSAQYVDDAIYKESEVNEDGGMINTIPTAHSNLQAMKNANFDHLEQRQVWVPFHFLPGNKGETLSEKLQCQKDSDIAQEMVTNHVEFALKNVNSFGLYLIGIMAHVYADTFAHYGFSGVSSSNNSVVNETIHFKKLGHSSMNDYVKEKFSNFEKEFSEFLKMDNWRKFVCGAAQDVTGSLGHAGVATYPDRPFLKWRFNYEKGNKDSGWRNNPETYLEYCKKIHEIFSNISKTINTTNDEIDFQEIEKTVKEILMFEGKKEDRIERWKEAINSGKFFKNKNIEALDYNYEEWEKQKIEFKDLSSSSDGINLDIYKFYQAASYHKDYVLKRLLSAYGIVIS